MQPFTLLFVSLRINRSLSWWRVYTALSDVPMTLNALQPPIVSVSVRVLWVRCRACTCTVCLREVASVPVHVGKEGSQVVV